MSDSEFNCSYDSDSDAMDSVRKKQLLNQIAELQNAVTDMKSAFTVAIQQLSRVQLDDQGLSDKVEQNKTECLDQVSEIFKLMLTMKAEFVTLKNQMSASNETQQNLQRQVQNLTWERDLLIEELYKSGNISDEIRYHLQNLRQVGRASSGSHSNDSGVILVLEKGQPAFQNNSSFLASSDQDYMSIPDHCPPILVSHLVHDYVAGLKHSQTQQNKRAVSSFGDGDNSTLAYDSDSSLVNAANKSLSLSTSLGKQCGLELDLCDAGSDDDDRSDNNAALDVAVDDSAKTALHAESDERWRVFKETLDTEKRYCKALWTLQDTFAIPLKQSGILSSKDINTLFPEEIFQLYGKHCILLHSLEERLQGWGRQGTIGDIFHKFTDAVESNVLQLYTTYVDDFPEVLKTFHKLCRQSPKFTRFLKTCMLQPSCRGLDLGAYLVTPVQRIPHYILLLKRMLRVTEEGHPDIHPLNTCLQRLKDFLDRLNDTMEHSFQLITAQIQPEDDPELRPARCAKSKPKHVAIEGVAASLPNTNTANGTNDEDDDSDCKRGQGKNCHILCKGQNEATSLQMNVKLSSVNRLKLRKKSRSESLVSSLSANSESDEVGFARHRMKGSGTALDGILNARQTDRQQLYYWPDEPHYQCESGPDSIETDDSTAAIKNPDNVLRHISEDSDTDGDTSNLPDETDDSEIVVVAPRLNMLSSKSMQDVKQVECPSVRLANGSSDNIASSQPNLIESETADPPKCCRSSCCAIGRGVSMACISPTEKEMAGRGKEEGRLRSRWGRRPLGKAQSSHSVHNLAREQQQICSCSTLEDSCNASKKKKKNFLRTSLKNILLFKKRSNSRAITTLNSSSRVASAVAIPSDELEKSSGFFGDVVVRNRCRRPSTDCFLEQCDCRKLSRDNTSSGYSCAGLRSSSVV